MNSISIEFKRLIRVFVGTVITCVGIIMFYNPSNLLAGGVMGFSMTIVYALDNVGIHLNLGLIMLVLNIPIIIIGLVKISKKFVYYSVFSILLQVLILSIFNNSSSLFGVDVVPNAVYGGLLIGIGSGIVLQSGASLGGIDIISQVLSILKQWPVGIISLISNTVIVLISILIFSADIALFTMLGFIVTHLTVDKIHIGYKRVKLEIITANGQQVVENLLKNYAHGLTVHESIGAFTNKKKQSILMVVLAHEVYDIKKTVTIIDSHAFMLMTPIKQINGNFKSITIK